MKQYQNQSRKLIRRLGANSSYLGFEYLAYGISRTLNDPTLLTYICKGLYVEIAIHFHTTLECVERDIRTVKDIIWEYGDKELLREIFGELIEEDKSPTNGKFIDGLVEYMKEFNQVVIGNFVENE